MSVALCCDMVETINITDANSMITVHLVPSIVAPATVFVDGTSHYSGVFYNSAFGGAFQATATSANTFNLTSRLLTSIQNYRVTSQSATVELIAPSLSDQGTITAAQYRFAPRTCAGAIFAGENSTVTQFPDLITIPSPIGGSQMVLGTSAYTSKARDGCYMPLKLTNFKWHSINDRAVYFDVVDMASTQYPETKNLLNNVAFPISERRGSATWDTAAIPKLCGNGFGKILMSGVAANTAVRIRVRQVVEITATPGTTYAPLLESALPPDETSMKMYFEVSSRMADAYPASYNDLGTLFEKIKSIGKAVLPFVEPALNVLSAVPGPVGAIASGVKTVAPVVKSVVSSVSSARKKPKQKAVLKK